ncbi:putative Polycomb group protein ASXL2 [Trichomycterus rosablanca]|uniref:putative Polycomb group protein ASXL2 n=1 Tax=Trichomycterus rosablanca TaxID=2290929 RepID=UPI002F357840
MRERQKKKKGRTWAEAARTVLEKFPNTPMSHKEILQVIQRERLKEISGTSPLACLNAMLHTNSRGEEGIFYKIPGRMGVYTLKKDIADAVKKLSEEASEDSSDDMSTARNRENNNGASSKEGRKQRWRRRGTSKLQSQPSSPQSHCSSPSVSNSKLMSPSQKHSKKALKQALKQQHQRNQRRQCGLPTTSSPRLLLKTVNMSDSASSKSGWEPKQSERCSASSQNSTSSSSSSVKVDVCHTTGARNVSQRPSRLSARQLRRTRCEIDVETPDSILVNTNLRALINKHTFSLLPSDCQQKLLKLLPEIDQQSCVDGLLRASSALNNEFFTSAAQSWKERLAEGEFTPELRLRMRQEIEKEKKVEHWKEQFFESYYGEQSGMSQEESKELTKSTCKQTKGSPISDKSESCTEAQKPNRTVEVTQKELRSRGVKLTVLISHQEPESSSEDSVKASPSAVDESTASSDTKIAFLEQVESTAALTKVEEPAVSSVTGETVDEHKPDSLTTTQEGVVTCSQGKDTLEIESMKVSPTPDSTVTTESLKRKVSVESELAEKKPCIAQTEGSPTTTSTTPALHRVPPLKIPVSRILSAPEASGQVSPRAPHPLTPPSIRPGGTGARTLADIKAKAKLAREQRAAAAAAANTTLRGTSSGSSSAVGTSTPSPSRSLSEEFSPASSRSQSVSPVKTNSAPPFSENAGVLSQACPFSGENLSTSLLNEKHSSVVSQTPQLVSNSHHSLNVEGIQKPSLNVPAQNQKEQKAHLTGSSVFNSSSLIPANNPLVTQLLQGKEIPLEKILPKPLPKKFPHSVASPVKEKGNLGNTTVALSKEKPLGTGDIGRARLQASSSRPGTSVDKLDKNTQERILHVLRHRSQQSNITMSVLQPSSVGPKLLGYVESCQDQPRFRFGLVGRKRMSKPAMTGHYLLNISTYGRGSENSKRPHLANVKKEDVGELKEGRDFKRGVYAFSGGHSNPPGIQIEPTKPDDAPGSHTPEFKHCSQIKLESQSLNCLSKAVDGTSTRTKEISPGSHLDSKQGISGPNQSDTDPDMTSYQSQTSHNQKETVTGALYGGTVSMAMPHAMNHSTDNRTSPKVTCSSDNANEGMMSFSVTVTAIPAGHLLDQGKGETSPEQTFIEASGMEDVQSKCYCRLKAMIMCKGCGAFCHDDCIGPSKLCVSCLVVR